MERWAWAAGAVAIAVAALRAWWARRTLQRQVATARAEVSRAELERDAAGGRAVTAEAQAAVSADIATRHEAAAEAAERIVDATSAAGDHLADRAALYDELRLPAGPFGPRARAGGDRPPAVRQPPAAGPGGRRDPGK
jgi:hypothetical protein